MANILPPSFSAIQALQQAAQQALSASSSTPNVVDDLDDFGGFVMDVRIARRRRMWMIPVFSIMAVGVICFLSGIAHRIWTSSISASAKLSLSGGIIVLLCGLYIVMVNFYEPWKAEGK